VVVSVGCKLNERVDCTIYRTRLTHVNP